MDPLLDILDTHQKETSARDDSDYRDLSVNGNGQQNSHALSCFACVSVEYSQRFSGTNWGRLECDVVTSLLERSVLTVHKFQKGTPRDRNYNIS